MPAFPTLEGDGEAQTSELGDGEASSEARSTIVELRKTRLTVLHSPEGWLFFENSKCKRGYSLLLSKLTGVSSYRRTSNEFRRRASYVARRDVPMLTEAWPQRRCRLRNKANPLGDAV